ncbi:hypothetical protein RFZ44_25780, partial [Acinetobacter sp. 163]|nr:hypothetical protein [Acinetobacter sp. 163]
HWRAHADSTAENPESKRYAFEAGRRDSYHRILRLESCMVGVPLMLCRIIQRYPIQRMLHRPLSC